MKLDLLSNVVLATNAIVLHNVVVEIPNKENIVNFSFELNQNDFSLDYFCEVLIWN